MRLLAVASLLLLVEAQKDPHWATGRSTIAQLFEWKFSDIADECERFLAPAGYAGVQTSTVHENIALPQFGRPWWERYQPISYKIISRSGDERTFADMVRRCNNVGVRVYVDIVLNHMTRDFDNATGYGGSTADTYNLVYYDVPFGPEDFHHPVCALNNFGNATEVRDCDLVGLHDLNQTRPYVRQKIVEFLDRLVDHGVAGFRVDLATFVSPEDLRNIYNKVKNLNTVHGFAPGSRPFVYQEVQDYGFPQVLHRDDYLDLGVITEFGVGRELSQVFNGNTSLSRLSNWGPQWGLLASSDALAFVNNHDTERDGSGFLMYREPKQYKMANAFMLAWPYGFTRVTSGFAFSDTDSGPPADQSGNIMDVTINNDGTCNTEWVCEHRWKQISNMVQFRNTAKGTSVQNWWDNGDKQAAFCRGSTGFIAFNNQANTDLKQTLQTCLPEGTYCDLISGAKENGRCTDKCVIVRSDGKAFIEILGDEEDGVLAISRDSKLETLAKPTRLPSHEKHRSMLEALAELYRYILNFFLYNH